MCIKFRFAFSSLFSPLPIGWFILTETFIQSNQD